MANQSQTIAGLKRATDEGSLPEIAQYSPYYLPLNVFTASKGSNLYILIPYEAGTKVYINGPGHMTKIAAMPIYGGKTFKKSSLEPDGLKF